MVFGARRRVRAALAEAALDYARARAWAVTPGASLARAGRGQRCSCASADCPSPGSHPANQDWARTASADPAVVRAMWSRAPDAPILLPTGLAFDVIDVPDVAGFRALARLERMGARLGPVAATPTGRIQFYVDAGAAVALPSLLRRLGWDGVSLDVRCHGLGEYVVAPPSPMGSAGSARWVRRPTHTNSWLPEARLLLGAITYACHRVGGPNASGASLWRAG